MIPAPPAGWTDEHFIYFRRMLWRGVFWGVVFGLMAGCLTWAIG